MHPMMYVSLLMNYLQEEYDNIPTSFTLEMDEFFRGCFEKNESIPNAAGMFYETFLRSKL